LGRQKEGGIIKISRGRVMGWGLNGGPRGGMLGDVAERELCLGLVIGGGSGTAGNWAEGGERKKGVSGEESDMCSGGEEGG